MLLREKACRKDVGKEVVHVLSSPEAPLILFTVVIHFMRTLGPVLGQ